jgi:hypothetical protein
MLDAIRALWWLLRAAAALVATKRLEQRRAVRDG